MKIWMNLSTVSVLAGGGGGGGDEGGGQDRERSDTSTHKKIFITDLYVTLILVCA